MKVYRRTENGNVTFVSLKEGSAEMSHAQMEGKRQVREMFAGSTGARITYHDGRIVLLLKVDAPEKETASAPVETTPPALEQATSESAPEAHVMSILGGKVHLADSQSPVPFPLCGSGSRNTATKYRKVTAPITCLECGGILRRRAARLAREAAGRAAR